MSWTLWPCSKKGRFNMRLPVVRKNKKTIICLSLFILSIDLIFLTINFLSLRETLYSSLVQQAKTHQEEFRLNLKMAYNSMLQMSTLISSNSELSQRLLEEEKTVTSQCKDEEGDPFFQNRADKKSANEKKPVRTYQFGSLENKSPLYQKQDRTYSWLRGVSPVWAVDPVTQEKVYVGALEVSTSL